MWAYSGYCYSNIQLGRSLSHWFRSVFPLLLLECIWTNKSQTYPEQSVHDIFNAIVQNEQKHRSAYIDQALRQQNNERDCNDTRKCWGSSTIDVKTVVHIAAYIDVKLTRRALSNTVKAGISKRKIQPWRLDFVEQCTEVQSLIAKSNNHKNGVNLNELDRTNLLERADWQLDQTAILVNELVNDQTKS